VRRRRSLRVRRRPPLPRRAGLPLGALEARLVLLVLLAVVPALGLLFYDTASSHAREISAEEARVEGLASAAAVSTRALVEATVGVLDALAADPTVRVGGPDCDAFLASVARQSPVIGEIGVALLPKRLSCSAHPPRDTTGYLAIPALARALAETTPRPVLSTGEHLGHPVLTVAEPLSAAGTARGASRAVLFATVDLDRLLRLAADFGLPTGFSLVLLDPSGHLYATLPAEPGLVPGSLSRRLAALARAVRRHALADAPLAPGPDGVVRVFAAAPLGTGRLAPGTLYIAIGIPIAPALARLDERFHLELAAVALVGTLALAVAVFVGARLFERLQRQALFDALTGADTRAHFGETVARELGRTRRSGQSLALLLVDLDHFKSVNDAHGHAAGDVVLRTVVEVLRSVLREGDAIGRIGGEELAVLLPATAPADAVALAERLRVAVEATPVRVGSHLELQVTVSIGVTVGSGTVQFEDLLRAADAALYLAKRSGRNTVRSLPATPAPTAGATPA